MTCPTSEFEFLPRRGFTETLLLVPGWATDHRIFAPLDLEFNYLAPVSFSPRDFQEGLLSALRRHRLDRVAVLGWSLGGYLALEFARAHPERVMEGALFAVGMRERYDAEVHRGDQGTPGAEQGRVSAPVLRGVLLSRRARGARLVRAGVARELPGSDGAGGAAGRARLSRLGVAGRCEGPVHPRARGPDRAGRGRCSR